MRAASVSRLVAVTLLLAWCCPSAAIKVPVSWEASDYEEPLASAESSEEEPASEQPQSFKEWTPPIGPPRNQRVELQEEQRRPPPPPTTHKPVPIEYFEYPARKPQFAVDVATFHGVPSPHQQYRATPVRPHAPRTALVLGHHAIPARPIFEPFQTFIDSHDGLSRYLAPASTDYEVFHPYKAEELGLKTHYNDPHLEKVKNDVEENKNRLQQYEKDAGQANIESDDYTKTPEQTDRELFGQAYKPNEFEEYRPEKTPHYYSPPPKPRLPHDYLNKKLKYPLNQSHIKIKPIHYQPLRNRLKSLRHKHQNQYGDERNEYPQPGPRHKQHFAEPPDGYDIYQKEKEHFNRYQNDVDLALNKYSNDYRVPSYGEDETGDLVKNSDQHKNKPQSESEEDDFVPIKMYAQVRKTESVKHLPKEAAFDEAETPEDILNAPRLREAVKSTKAQTIYSEEGYEDKAYDHEGQQKHASNHEGHGGYLKEKENSGGRYKIPFVQHDFEEGDGVTVGNTYTHKEKYKNEDGRSEDEDDSEISTANENEHDENDYDLDEAGSENLDGQNSEETLVPKAVLSLTKDSEKTTIHDENYGRSIKTETEHMTATNNNNEDVKENKTGTGTKSKDKQKSSLRRKRNVNFEVPDLNLDNTYLTESEIVAISKQKLAPVVNKLKIKYPYYFMTNINKNSPLKYAVNMKYIPRKTKGGTEFYDSRSVIECPDVEPEIDPVPKKLNGAELDEKSEDNKEESSEHGSVKEEEDIEQFNRRKRQSDFSTINKSPRLRGLGDNIDCFKEKYFDENPLDSPFFVEDIIHDPEPLKELKLDVYQIRKSNGDLIVEPSELNEIFTKENLKESNVDKVHSHNDNLSNTTEENNYPSTETITASTIIKEIPEFYPNLQQSNVYSDVMQNIQSHLKYTKNQSNNKKNIVPLLLSRSILNEKEFDERSKQFNVYLNKEDVTIRSPSMRVKRSNQFIYEPYKVIREHQEPDSKKTTTSGNVSPLIKQLQASKVADHTIRSKEETRAQFKVQPVKRNIKEKNYKDIHREDRAKHKEQNNYKDFVDVSVDRRRGEPRYELSQLNHKTKYTPVTNTRSLSLEEYKLRSNARSNDETKDIVDENKREEISEETENITDSPISRSLKPYFDVSAYIPRVRRPLKQLESVTLKHAQNSMKIKPNNLDVVRLQESSSENLHKIIMSKSLPNKKPETTSKPTVYDTAQNTSEDNEEYEEYDEEHAVTTTTRKPVKIKRKIKVRTTTTSAPVPVQDYDYIEEEPAHITSTTTSTTTPKPKIKFLRRLRKPVNQDSITSNSTNEIAATKIDSNKYKKPTTSQKNNPKIQEKTVKTEKSTMITDSKSYGDEDDSEDMQKEQIDEMIGGRENMKDFIEDFDEPNMKERGEVKDLVLNARRQDGSEREDERETNSSEESDDRARLEQVDEDDEDDGDERDNVDDRDDGDELPGREDSEEDEIEDDSRESIIDRQSEQPTPINKTSQQTDDIILPVVKKRIIIKRPLPTKPESALAGKYRQSSERTVAVPGRLEPLQTYRDKAIAEDVNRLADVEVFDEDIMKTKGPRHGGNYRSEKLIEELDERTEAEEEAPRMHGGNLQAAPATAAAEPRRSAAALLNTLAQAATVLTTTPRYILDPSKRMYYYVDAR